MATTNMMTYDDTEYRDGPLTVITTHGTVTLDAAYWARGSDGDIHIYSEPDESDSSDTIATIEGARFVAIYLEEDAVEASMPTDWM